MKRLEISIPIGLGDAIYSKAQLDAVKDQYTEIKISFYKKYIEVYRNSALGYSEFLDQLGELLFAEKPYSYSQEVFPLRNVAQISSDWQIYPQKPNLKSYFCHSDGLQFGKPYLVLNTKVRFLARETWDKNKNILFQVLNKLSSKYFFVLLGEKEVEMNSEYQIFGSNGIYSLYSDFLNYLPVEKLIDLTIPALGISCPNLTQILNDSQIINQAHRTITIGIGGSFCLSTAVGNVIGWRQDDDAVANYLYDKIIYPDAFITKNFNSFISKLLEL